MWKINYPTIPAVMLKEFKKIALGEFFDDVKFLNGVKSSLGMTSKPDETQEGNIDQKDESGNIIDNIGLTIFFVSIGLALIVTFVVLGTCLAKKYSLSLKWQNRFNEAKTKVFFNPLIRYSLLNALKLNMTAFAVFKNKDLDSPQAFVAYLLCAVMISLPILYAVFLHKNQSKLADEAFKLQYGVLYEDLNIRTHKKKLKISFKVYLY